MQLLTEMSVFTSAIHSCSSQRHVHAMGERLTLNLLGALQPCWCRGARLTVLVPLLLDGKVESVARIHGQKHDQIPTSGLGCAWACCLPHPPTCHTCGAILISAVFCRRPVGRKLSGALGDCAQNMPRCLPLAVSPLESGPSRAAVVLSINQPAATPAHL